MNNTSKVIATGLVTAVLICGSNFLIDRASTAMIAKTRIETNVVTTVTEAPYVNHGDTIPLEALHPGEVFFVHSRFHRMRQGNWTIAIIMRSSDDLTNLILLNASDWLPGGDFEKNERLELPADIPLGHYTIFKKIINFDSSTYYLSTLYNIKVDVVAVPAK